MASEDKGAPAVKGWVTSATAKAVGSRGQGAPAKGEGTESEEPSKGVSQDLRVTSKISCKYLPGDPWPLGPQV